MVGWGGVSILRFGYVRVRGAPHELDGVPSARRAAATKPTAYAPVSDLRVRALRDEEPDEPERQGGRLGREADPALPRGPRPLQGAAADQWRHGPLDHQVLGQVCGFVVLNLQSKRGKREIGEGREVSTKA